ncbi:albusnodin family lasso peptide [Kitasatospora misakiensis]|uniref:Albusnodin family lasso peptide n=1 Tax=Kitasatospora misakiensis TaxID=67330 RepID=A0ABW0XC62_9ACTN
MFEQQTTEPEDDDLTIEIGDLTALTEGQGKGSSEDKRRAYNS